MEKKELEESEEPLYDEKELESEFPLEWKREDICSERNEESVELEEELSISFKKVGSDMSSSP